MWYRLNTKPLVALLAFGLLEICGHERRILFLLFLNSYLMASYQSALIYTIKLQKRNIYCKIKIKIKNRSFLLYNIYLKKMFIKKIKKID